MTRPVSLVGAGPGDPDLSTGRNRGLLDDGDSRGHGDAPRQAASNQRLVALAGRGEAVDEWPTGGWAP